MHISFEFVVQNELLGQDASLSFGYLKIETRGLTLGFFQDKNCRIFSTLAWLLEGISLLINSESKQYEWIGDGYGATYIVELEQQEIIFSNLESKIAFKFSTFSQALLSATEELIASSATANPRIVSESAFMDLKTSFEFVRTIIR